MDRMLLDRGDYRPRLTFCGSFTSFLFFFTRALYTRISRTPAWQLPTIFVGVSGGEPIANHAIRPFLPASHFLTESCGPPSRARARAVTSPPTLYTACLLGLHLFLSSLFTPLICRSLDTAVSLSGNLLEHFPGVVCFRIACISAERRWGITMDDYMFQANVDRCKQVEEVTHYLEIFQYSVSEQQQKGVHMSLTHARTRNSTRWKSIH